jgi:SAM-dependent methyltransferase
MTDSTQRFSNRVKNYVCYRPNYPQGVVAVLQAETALTKSSVIADIGSGTGLSAELFLQNGNAVFGVEPNLAMRQAAEQHLKNYSQFYSVDGTAEATTLPSGSVDYALAAQAFHWFNPQQARQEVSRILKPGGWGVLIWNVRRTESTPFLRAYEALIQAYGIDYAAIGHQNIASDTLKAFFSSDFRPEKLEEKFGLRTLYNEQRFDFDGLKGRLLSSSYMPSEGHERFLAMVEDLRQLFDQYEENGLVRLEYDTEVYFGR